MISIVIFTLALYFLYANYSDPNEINTFFLFLAQEGLELQYCVCAKNILAFAGLSATAISCSIL